MDNIAFLFVIVIATIADTYGSFNMTSVFIIVAITYAVVDFIVNCYCICRDIPLAF